MTISTTTSNITYLGNGITTAFSFPFVADQASDLIVTLTVLSTGVETVLSPAQYSVILNPIPVGQLWAIGGTVNYPLVGSPLSSGTTITITRAVPYQQLTSIGNQGAFYPQSVELALDILALEIQQIETAQSYAVQAPLVDSTPLRMLPPAAQRANGYLGFDGQGQPVVFVAAPSVVPVASAQPRRINTTGTNTVNVLISDSLAGVSINQSSTPVTTVQLPAGFGPYPIFDGSGNAGTFPITILPPAGLHIQGQTSFTLAFNYQSIICYNDGTQILLH